MGGWMCWEWAYGLLIHGLGMNILILKFNLDKTSRDENTCPDYKLPINPRIYHNPQYANPNPNHPPTPTHTIPHPPIP